MLCDLWLSKRSVSCGSSQRTHSKKFPWDGLVRRSRESFVGVLKRFVRAQGLRRGSRESFVGVLERLPVYICRQVVFGSLLYGQG